MMSVLQRSGIVFAVLLLLGAGCFSKKAEEPTPETVVETPEIQEDVAEDVTTDGVFVLYKEYGDVFYKSSSSNSFARLASDEVELGSGTTVKTEEGLAYAILPDQSMVSIAENTELEISFDGESTTLFQSIGKTWHRVKKVLTRDDSYQVETPTALATVRGTKFAVEVLEDSDESAVLVAESIVDVEQRLEGVDVFRNGKAVGAGKRARVQRSGIRQVVDVDDIPEEIRTSAWFRLNQLIDSEYDRTQIDVTRVRSFMQRLKNNTELQSTFKARLQTMTADTDLTAEAALPKAPEEDVTVEILDPIEEPIVDIIKEEPLVEDPVILETPIVQELPPPDQDQLSDDDKRFLRLIIVKYDLSFVSREQACVNVYSDSYSADLKSLDEIGPRMVESEYQTLRTYLINLREFCADQTIDDNEFELLYP